MDHWKTWNIYYEAWGKQQTEIRKQRAMEHAKKQMCTVVLNHYDNHHIITLNNNIPNNNFNHFNNLMKINPLFSFLEDLSNQLLEKYQVPIYDGSSPIRNYKRQKHKKQYDILRRVIPKPSHRTRFHCLRCPQERRGRQESLHRVDAILAYF